MTFIALNDQIIEANALNFYQVERFRVADACFESMLYSNTAFPLIDYHQERLNHTCELFGLEPYLISESLILALIKKNKLKTHHAKVRISVVRKNGRNYKPLGHARNVLIEVMELKDIFNAVAQLGTFTAFKKPLNAWSAIKSSNALAYVMALKYAEENGFNDVLILNESNHWIEASSSNLFIIKDQVIYTSKDNSACVLGVSRSFLINFLAVEYVDITDNILMEADEIFLSNAIQLIQIVENFQGRNLATSKTKELIQLTAKKLGV